MHLNSFPSDVLSRILHFHGDPINLWICGNPLFNLKLANSATTVEKRTISSNDSLRTKFPSLLFNCIALRTLSLISSSSLLEDPRQWTATLQKLPQTLEFIKLESLESHLAIMNFHPDWTSSDPLYITTDYSRGSSRFIDLEPLFPRLHTLQLLSSARNAGEDAFASEDLAGLPSTLTCFWSIPIVIDGDSSFMRALPRSLVDLDMPVTVRMNRGGVHEDFAHAPPGLHTFPDLSWVGLQTDLSWIPKTLTHCNLSSPFVFDETTVHQLPKGLRSLTLSKTNSTNFFAASPSENWVALLPRSLTNLDLFSSFMLSIKADDIPFLPPALTCLSCNRGLLDFESIRSGAISWSNTPSLVILSIPANIITPDDFILLPRTLTYVRTQVRHANQVVKIDSKTLPPSLTVLDLSGQQTLSFSDELPSTLTVLFALESTVPTFGLDVESVAKLPATLSKLSVNLIGSHTALGQSGLRFTLPSALVTLNVFQWYTDWASFIPRTVTSLTIVILKVIKTKNLGEKDLFCDFPPNLTLLSLREMAKYGPQRTQPNQLSASSFSSLAHLRSLKIPPSDASFPSATLQSLPKSLEELHFGLQSLEESDAPFLPPSATSLRLYCPIDRDAPWFTKYWPSEAVCREAYP